MGSWHLTQTGSVHMGHRPESALHLESSGRRRKRGSRCGMDSTLTVRRLVSGALEEVLGGYLQ